MKWRTKIMVMFFVVWVITAAGETVFLEAANGSYASNPIPADGAVIVGDMVGGNISTELIFVPGATAVGHTGYFSDDYSKVESRVQDANLGPPPYDQLPDYKYTFFVGNPVVPPADETLVRGVTYYWCVDETDSLGTTYPGDIWEFTVQDDKTCCPNPPDGAVVLGPDVLLSWGPGYGAEEYDVYFGTDFNDVNDGSSGPGDPYPPAVYLGTVTEPNILVTGLVENTWYYWRVDGVAGRVPPFFIPTEYYKGDVWCFKTAGLIAHWKFDEGSGTVAYDSAGDNDGNISGAAWTTGIIDGALDFDGVDDYVAVPDDPALSPEQITISAWIYPEDVSHNFQIVGKWGMNNPPSDYIFDNKNNNDGLRFATSMNFSGYDMVVIYSEDAVLNANMWQHVAVTWDGSTCTFYVNSENVGEDSNYSGSLPDSDNPVYIGRNYNWGTGGPRPLDGKMDDVRIYDRALSAGEIEELYNSVPVPPVGKTYHVDGVTGDNTNDGLTPETAFKTIQRGINVAEDFDTVLVWPGVYNEEIAFWGDAITVKSAADAAIVETNYGYAFSFFSAEGHDTVLSNFVIRSSQYGIYLINGASPTLRNLTIVNNDFGISAFNGADPDISSCIFWNNYYGDLFRDPVPLEAKYSWVQDEVNEPIAHWKLDEGSGTIAYDSAGTNDGTIYGAAWATGVIDGALDFDGVDDYVDCGADSSLNISGAITITAWIHQKAYANGAYGTAIRKGTNQYLLEPGDWGKDDCWLFGVDIGTFTQVETLLGFPINMWHHVAGTYDGSILNIYVDGKIQNSKSASGVLQSQAGDLHIGNGWYFGEYENFEGLIDDVRIYDRALSAGEIEAIYEAGLSGISYGGPGFVDANGGDYHLLSERGRYWPAHDVWVLDDATSPCIDGGDPAVDPSNERMPNGGRINMGAYGNTAYASMSECWSKADFNCDGAVDFKDFAIMAAGWLDKAAWIE